MKTKILLGIFSIIVGISLIGAQCATTPPTATPTPTATFTSTPTATPPTTHIISAVYSDKNANYAVDTNDTIIVTFDNAIDPTTLDTADATSDFVLHYAGTPYSWRGTSSFIDVVHKVVKIVLGSKIEGFVPGTDKIRVKPGALTDESGNPVSTNSVIVH